MNFFYMTLFVILIKFDNGYFEMSGTKLAENVKKFIAFYANFKIILLFLFLILLRNFLKWQE
jgi:hypothetical protein